MKDSTYQPNRSMGLLRLSNRAETYLDREEGMFLVQGMRYQLKFNTLVAAFLFYLDVPGEAILFDITEGIKMIECKRFLN